MSTSSSTTTTTTDDDDDDTDDTLSNSGDVDNKDKKNKVGKDKNVKKNNKRKRKLTKVKSRKKSGGDGDDYDDDDDDDIEVKDDDRVHKKLKGKKGLHAGQNATKGRVKNPSRYTDKSLKQNKDKTLSDEEKKKRYITKSNKDVGYAIHGICTNIYGNVKECHNLLTDYNYRVTFLTKNRFPINFLLSLLFDVADTSINKLDKKLILKYYFRIVKLLNQGDSMGFSDREEEINSIILARFTSNMIHVLSRIDMATGNLDPIEMVSRKYQNNSFPFDEFKKVLEKTLPNVTESSVPKSISAILEYFKEIVERTRETNVRIWGLSPNINNNSKVVKLRKHNLKDSDLINSIKIINENIETLKNLIIDQTDGNSRASNNNNNSRYDSDVASDDDE